MTQLNMIRPLIQVILVTKKEIKWAVTTSQREVKKILTPPWVLAVSNLQHLLHFKSEILLKDSSMLWQDARHVMTVF